MGNNLEEGSGQDVDRQGSDTESCDKNAENTLVFAFAGMATVGIFCLVLIGSTIGLVIAIQVFTGSAYTTGICTITNQTTTFDCKVLWHEGWAGAGGGPRIDQPVANSGITIATEGSKARCDSLKFPVVEEPTDSPAKCWAWVKEQQQLQYTCSQQTALWFESSDNNNVCWAQGAEQQSEGNQIVALAWWLLIGGGICGCCSFCAFAVPLAFMAFKQCFPTFSTTDKEPHAITDTTTSVYV